jgi:hypothetical protein
MGVWRATYCVLVEKSAEENHLEDLGLDGSKTLNIIVNKYFGVVNWIVLAQESDKLLTILNTVMSHQFPSKAGKFLTK